MKSSRLIVPTLLTAIVVFMVAEPAHASPVPIPEPATLTLLSAGAAAIRVLTWWRKRK